jgi:hypothetical protein
VVERIHGLDELLARLSRRSLPRYYSLRWSASSGSGVSRSAASFACGVGHDVLVRALQPPDVVRVRWRHQLWPVRHHHLLPRPRSIEEDDEGEMQSAPASLHLTVVELDLTARRVLTVNSCIKVRLDLQADKSPAVVKGPFFPRVVNPRYRIHGTMCNARIQSSKAR